MAEVIKEPISVGLVFNHVRQRPVISHILWHNKVYRITNQGMYHNYRNGDNILHVFSVASNTISFRIVLNSANLTWILEETHDQNFN